MGYIVNDIYGNNYNSSNIFDLDEDIYNGRIAKIKNNDGFIIFDGTFTDIGLKLAIAVCQMDIVEIEKQIESLNHNEHSAMKHIMVAIAKDMLDRGINLLDYLQIYQEKMEFADIEQLEKEVSLF